MLPWILDKYINDEEQIENMRALFKEADSDYSGYLTPDEFYVCLLKIGADITR
jgi:Ca2+-binding EF-hand superfamily protein